MNAGIRLPIGISREAGRQSKKLTARFICSNLYMGLTRIRLSSDVM